MCSIKKFISNALVTLVMLIIMVSMAHADVSSDLNSFFDGLGMVSNTTAPHAYQGQQAGYYSGGSLYARSSVRNVQLVQIDLPSFRSGCGGIDLFAGGFSFVNSDQLVSTMRNVMNNAKGYAMTLAMEEMTPQIANAMKYIQDMANKANQMNINSCETAEALVGGMWPKTRAAQQQVCQDVGSNTGIFRDWAEARQGCTSDDFDSTMKAGSENPAYHNLVLDNGNLVWKALQANNLVAGDQQFAELLMSLSGSIIIKKTGSGKSSTNHIEVLQSLATDRSLFKAILYGDSTTIYHCDEATQCLNPKPQTITVTQQAALKNRVAALLHQISQKIVADDPLTKEEIGLIQSTRIPIYKILNVQAAYQKDANILDVESYADVIATDILFQYLQENLSIVRASSRALQYPEEIMTQFNAGINAAMSDVRLEEHNAQNKISQAMQLIEQSQVLEQMLAGQLSVQLGSSLHFARSLH
jgi:conjugative transfer pilus assembly protein TraH